MAVDTPRIEYLASSADWRRVRDVLGGQAAMQANGDSYLRRAPGMADADWTLYIQATPFFEATARTLEGLTGLAFYRDPELTFPDQLQPVIQDATGDGVPFMQFVETVTEEVLSIGRFGIMVDMPPVDPDIKTRAQEEASGRRPFVRGFQAENIISWRRGDVEGMSQLVEVRVLESVEEPSPDDEFEVLSYKQIRVLNLDQVADVWTYRQRVYRFSDPETLSQDGAGATPPPSGRRAQSTTLKALEGWNQVGGTIVPLIDGKPLDFIPFWIVNPTDQTPDIKRPPLIGLANVNVSHFNTSGMLENALFFVGNPTPWVTGQDPKDVDDIKIGSTTTWVFANADAKVGILSLESDKVQGLTDRLADFLQQMAILGARMLSADKRQVEAAETARIHRQGEVSVLAGTCQSVSRTASDVLRVCGLFMHTAGDFVCNLNTKFFDDILTPTDALALVQVWQQGGIGWTDLVANFQRGGILAADRTADDIRAENQSGSNPMFDKLTAPDPEPEPPAPPEE